MDQIYFSVKHGRDHAQLLVDVTPPHSFGVTLSIHVIHLSTKSMNK